MPVFWSEDAAPAWVVRVAPAASIAGRFIPLAELLRDGISIADDGTLRLRLANALQVIVPAGMPPDTPVAVILPLDDLFEDRGWAADRLWDQLRGRPPPARLTAQHRERLAQMLRSVDGRQAGASYRMIAEALFGAARVPRGDAWKVSDLRSRTLRLVADGMELVRGGYRRLLTWRRRRP